jgi:hypothetical protein
MNAMLKQSEGQHPFLLESKERILCSARAGRAMHDSWCHA